MNLNAYHIKFLQLLVQENVRFIVIGGQARMLHSEYRSRDLDIWVDVSSDNQMQILGALNNWWKMHPLHSSQLLPAYLGPEIQIHIPEWDVYFFDVEGIQAQINAEDGIDILTALHDWDFEAVFRRSVKHTEHNMDLFVLNKSDSKLSDSMPRHGTA